MPVSLPLEEVKELASNSASCVKKAEGEVVLCLHPIYAADITKGVTEELNAMSSRYSKLLGGIPMGYEKVAISSSGGLVHTNPFMHFRVQATFYVFSPEVDSILEGTVKKKSPHHLSCLVHKMFNISVPRPQSISTQMWDGSSVEEGDTVRIIVTNVDMSFYLPMITGHLDIKSMDVKKEKLAVNKVVYFTEDNAGNAGVDSGIDSNEDKVSEDETTVKKEKVKKEKKKKGDVKVLAKKTGVKDKGKIKEKKKREEKKRNMKKEVKLEKDSEDDKSRVKNGSDNVDIRKEKKKKKKADKGSKKDKKEKKKKKKLEISEGLRYEEIIKRIKKEPVDSDSELPLRSEVLNKNILKKIKKEQVENDLSSSFFNPSLLKEESAGKCKKSKKCKSENKKERKERRDKMKLDKGKKSGRVKKCKVKKESRVDDCEKLSKIFPSTSFASQVVPVEKSKKRKAPDSPGESSKKKRKISTS